MMCPDLIRAKQILQTEGCTCVLCSDNTIYRSSIRGVKPLLELIETDTDTTGFSAADKVVGKAAAMLYCHLRVRQVYAPVMSKEAIKVLTDHGIEVFYDRLTDVIMNRAMRGMCPMELAVQTTDDPNKALSAVRDTLDRLQRE